MILETVHVWSSIFTNQSFPYSDFIRQNEMKNLERLTLLSVLSEVKSDGKFGRKSTSPRLSGQGTGERSGLGNVGADTAMSSHFTP